MERKNVFAGVVLLTAVLSTSSVFAAEQSGWWSKIKTTASTATAAVANFAKHNSAAVGTGVAALGLGYWSMIARAYNDPRYEHADVAQMLSNALVVGALAAAGATAVLAKDAIKACKARFDAYRLGSEAMTEEEYEEYENWQRRLAGQDLVVAAPVVPAAALVAPVAVDVPAAVPARRRRMTEAERLASTLRGAGDPVPSRTRRRD